jgi:hypothetical protein
VVNSFLRVSYVDQVGMDIVYIISRRIINLWAPVLPRTSISCRKPIQQSPLLQSSYRHESLRKLISSPF